MIEVTNDVGNYTTVDIRMEKKLIKKVATNIEENGIVGVRPLLSKKLSNTERVRVGVVGDSMSGKSSLIQALGGDLQVKLARIRELSM